ncbi:MAG: DUF3817 domain-containing protein [Bacteroidetes bacterium]|nr:DUF3817 domain-containing protein [Bacteroidota bacterium]
MNETNEFDASYFKIFRIIAFLEGLSYITLLGICVPLKHLMGIPEPTMVVGMTHGILFMLYILFALLVRSDVNWSFKTTLWVLTLSIIPFGTFYAEFKIFRSK